MSWQREKHGPWFVRRWSRKWSSPRVGRRRHAHLRRGACRRFQRRPTCSSFALRRERKNRVHQGDLFKDPYDIFSMNPDGSDQTNLTNNPADDSAPAWSPDGTRVAFTSDRGGDLEIFLMNADGSNQTNLTNNSADDAFSTWSPDGTRIAFATDRPNGEIFVMNADGSEQTNLTNDPSCRQHAGLVAGRDEDRVHQRPRRRLRDLRHERRRQQPNEPDQQSGIRLVARLVAGRNEDRLHERPRLATKRSSS